jgi:hypothetical protein
MPSSSKEHVMSQSVHLSEVEPRARWLADLDPEHLYTWMLRAVSRQQHDLLPPSPPGPIARIPALEAREAFIDWCAAGLDLFMREGTQLPSRRTIDDAAHRVMLAVVLRRHRSITAAAQALETSRRALRDTMKRLGLYKRWQQWQGLAGSTAPAPTGPNRSTSDGQSRPTTTEPRPATPLEEPPSAP